MTQASKWTFVGASYDSSSGDARLWSQGFFQTLNVGVGLDLSTGLNVRMGAKIGNSSYFKGRISQLQIFKRSLTPEEIQAVQSEVSGMKLCHKIFFFSFYYYILCKQNQKARWTMSLMWRPLTSCDLWHLFKIFMESIRNWRIHFTLWNGALRKHNKSSALHSLISHS